MNNFERAIQVLCAVTNSHIMIKNLESENFVWALVSCLVVIVSSYNIFDSYSK